MNTDTIARYWRGFADWASTPFALPDLAVARTEAAFIDTIACILAGFTTPAFSVARAMDHSVSGRAFAFATAGHAFDFDDYDVPSIGHPSVVMVPTVLALVDGSHSISDLFRAYVTGVEAMARMGETVNPAHYEAGWHATATLGGIGAAAAAAAMLRLNSEQTFVALSLATGMAGGLKAQFGSMGKPLNAGFAARRGIDAAILAKAGADASEAVFGAKGFAGLFHGHRPTPITQPGAPLSVIQHGLIAKPAPCCGYLMRSLQMAEDIRTTEAPGSDTIEKVILRIPPRNAAVINQPIPSTPDQARFSAPYCVSVALLNGMPGLADFQPEALFRPDVIALARKIDLQPLPANLSPEDLSPDDPDHIEVHLTSGKVLKRTEGVVLGSLARPLGRDDLRRKLDDCIALLPAPATAVAGRVMAISTCPDPASFVADLWRHSS